MLAFNEVDETLLGVVLACFMFLMGRLQSRLSGLGRSEILDVHEEEVGDWQEENGGKADASYHHQIVEDLHNSGMLCKHS